MKSDAFHNIVDTVKARTDLCALIRADVDLASCGSVLKGRSPWNRDENPSFVVWPDNGTWRDFSGGTARGGDCIDYVRARDGCGFMDALRTLAASAGVEMSCGNGGSTPDELKRLAERRWIEDVLSEAAAYYHSVLPTSVRRSWYQERYGFTDETIDRLMLGWSDGRLLGHLKEKLGITNQQALTTGLFVRFQNGGIVNLFQNRLVIPYWRGGRVAYFIARQTEHTSDKEWEKAKYKKLLTHSERHPYVSPVLINDTFYNEDSARRADELLITEGVTDCISAMQAGIACISPVTVRFRKQDHRKLLALTERVGRIFICNDNEENGAGEAGARETAQALHTAGRDVRMAVIPRPADKDKIDVNELVATAGAEALRTVLDNALSFPQYLIEQIPADTAVPDLEASLASVLSALVHCRPLQRDAYLDAIVSRFRLRRSVLNDLMKESRQRHARTLKDNSRKAASSLPEILCSDRQLRSILEESRSVVVAANMKRIEAQATADPPPDTPPPLFRRAGQVVYLSTPGTRPPEIAEWDDTAMFGLLVRDADWVRKDTDGVIFPDRPPKDIARDLVRFPPSQFPEVDSVITTPVFGSNGTLITEPGLHADEHLWHARDHSLRLPEVPEHPTRDDVVRARDMFLAELFVDFPFASDADRAHMLAAILLPFVRRMIHGLTPLHVVEAPSIGSGKGLLCHLTSVVATGKPAAVSTLPTDEDEVRKTLTAELIKAGPIVVIDNAKEGRIIDSQALTSLLTTEAWRNRILGKTEMIVLPNYALWMLTGNNPRLSDELSRRCIRIRIDPKRDGAWLRTGFKHDPIIPWAQEHRGDLVHAALVLVQAWIAAGCPQGQKRLGSFEHWAAVMDGLLATIEVPGFLGNLQEMQDNANAESELWKEFTTVWWGEFRNAPLRVSDLNQLCEAEGLLTGLRGDGTPRAQETRLGRGLQRMRDRVFGSLRVTLSRCNKHRGRSYALEEVGEDTAAITQVPKEEAAAVPEPEPPPFAGPWPGDIDPWA